MRPVPSRTRTPIIFTLTVPLRPVPMVSWYLAASSAASSSSTMSRSSGATASRTASRPPAVSAMTYGPSEANVLRYSAAVVGPNCQWREASTASGPK